MILLALAGLLQQASVGDLIRDLDHDDISVRRKASADLLSRGTGVKEALVVAMLRGESLEVKLAAKDLLEQLGVLPRGLVSRGMPVVRVDTVTDERRFGKIRDDIPSVNER